LQTLCQCQWGADICEKCGGCALNTAKCIIERIIFVAPQIPRGEAGVLAKLESARVGSNSDADKVNFGRSHHWYHFGCDETSELLAKHSAKRSKQNKYGYVILFAIWQNGGYRKLLPIQRRNDF
jgi:hypothetical protein